MILIDFGVSETECAWPITWEVDAGKHVHRTW